MHRSSLRTLLAASCALVGFGLAADNCSAARLYGAPGATLTETFDSLPNAPENTSLQATAPWADDTTSAPGITSIPGVYLFHPTSTAEGGVNGNQRFRISSAPGNTGSFYSLGPAGSGERALGAIGATTLAATAPAAGSGMYIALRLTNNTGVPLDQVTLTYTGEQWRQGGASVPDNLAFEWSVDAAATVSTGLYTAEPALDFIAPQTAAAAATLNGNDPANRTTLTRTFPVVWAPGADLWLRWTDPQINGADHALAIDDLSFSAVSTGAVPEPASAACVAFAAALLTRRRKR